MICYFRFDLTRTKKWKKNNKVKWNETKLMPIICFVCVYTRNFYFCIWNIFCAVYCNNSWTIIAFHYYYYKWKKKEKTMNEKKLQIHEFFKMKRSNGIHMKNYTGSCFDTIHSLCEGSLFIFYELNFLLILWECM